MATAASNTGELKIETTNIQTAPGVQLTSEQQTIVGSVLDLFAGRPSLAKLALWTDDGELHVVATLGVTKTLT